MATDIGRVTAVKDEDGTLLTWMKLKTDRMAGPFR